MSLMNAFVKRFAAPYQKMVGAKMRVYGLVHDDLLIDTPEVLKAVSRIDATTRLERERRIVRAFDLSVKRKALAREVSEVYDPMNWYLAEGVAAAKAEKEEKILMRP